MSDAAVREIRVFLENGGEYPVHVGPGALRALPTLIHRWSPAARYALIADERVAAIHGAGVLDALGGLDAPVTVHSFPPGEASKSRTEWARLTDELLAEGVGRDGCVIALGGGVTGDLAGFVAATYMRGVPVVQVPTTLVAMVDSSVGGKTGIDVAAGKNLVGAFHPPRFVLADTELTATLPPSERSQGLAEAVKHGAILDADYFGTIREHATQLMDGDPTWTARIVARSVELKAAVVGEDEREAGYRQILNFGHTLGHALEAASGYRLAHGSAVALGMILEARLGERLRVTREGTSDTLAEALRDVRLPTEVSFDVDPEELLTLTGRDKKVRDGVARYVLLEDIGRVDRTERWARGVESEVVRGVLEEVAARMDVGGASIDAH